MKKNVFVVARAVVLAGCLLLPLIGPAQERPAAPAENPVLKTPLPQRILDLLANEISGQLIYNNEVKLAGAPWQRDDKEFADTFYETRVISELVRGYGISTTEVKRYKADGTFDYPVLGELWMTKPEVRLIARTDADPALVSRGSADVDLTASLAYVPPLTKEVLDAWAKNGAPEKISGKVVLMWSHANPTTAKALDAAGVRGVITFSAQDRYFDPDQVLYSGGTYAGFKNLQFGLTVSWRQWSELLDETERGGDIAVRARTKLNKYPNRFEEVFSWIPGREPDKKGVIFTGHLYEGYVKRGANDNMSGCVVQLEILRALDKLISRGDLPRPRRTIYFLWPNEISGTYEFLKQNPGFAGKLSININMDMVGEALRKNNGLFTMSECPNHLPSYLDGLAEAMMNYVWRTNDIVYLNDSPRSRLPGQNFPRPMWEKNGSRDAFRYFVHAATGGSDHVCFNNPAVAVPGVEFFTWPDQWYHADKDTPDKSDPTEMKRVAFIGAAAAWAAANCEDDILPDVLNAVSAFGYARVGKRELPAAFRKVDAADAKTLAASVNRAVNLVRFAAGRERGAVASLEEVFSGSNGGTRLIESRKKQWELYADHLAAQVLAYGGVRADQFKVARPKIPAPDKLEKQYDLVVPVLHPEVRGMEFALESSGRYKKYMEANPDALKEVKLAVVHRRGLLNYINGQRTVTDIRNALLAETGQDVDFPALAAYLGFLKAVGWVVY